MNYQREKRGGLCRRLIVRHWRELKSSSGLSNKRLKTDLGGLKEMFEEGQIIGIEWIKGKEQVADGLMKEERVGEWAMLAR